MRLWGFANLSKFRQKITKSLFASATNTESFTVGGDAEVIEFVKKSKFVARLRHTKSINEALSFLDEVKDPKASHNCWAFRGSKYERCSDDGEPSGTAGRPILNALESENIYDATIVVTRYFGGTKLGTGGLMRSYFSSAQSAARAAQKVLHVPTTIIKISAAAKDLGLLHQVVLYCNSQNNGPVTRLGETFDHQLDEVCLSLRVPKSILDQLKQRLSDVCKGRSKFEEINETEDH